MTTVTKIAFYDPATDEYYCGEKDFQKLSFKKDISKAKLYTGNDSSFAEGFNYVNIVSKRELICIDVEVTFDPIKIESSKPGQIFTKKLEKLYKEFDPLNKIAEIDVDNLSEKDYQQWKKLRHQIADLERTT